MDVDVDESSTSVSDSDHRGSIASLSIFSDFETQELPEEECLEENNSEVASNHSDRGGAIVNVEQAVENQRDHEEDAIDVDEEENLLEVASDSSVANTASLLGGSDSESMVDERDFAINSDDEEDENLLEVFSDSSESLYDERDFASSSDEGEVASVLNEEEGDGDDPFQYSLEEPILIVMSSDDGSEVASEHEEELEEAILEEEPIDVERSEVGSEHSEHSLENVIDTPQYSTEDHWWIEFSSDEESEVASDNEEQIDGVQSEGTSEHSLDDINDPPKYSTDDPILVEVSSVDSNEDIAEYNDEEVFVDHDVTMNDLTSTSTSDLSAEENEELRRNNEFLQSAPVASTISDSAPSLTPSEDAEFKIFIQRTREWEARVNGQEVAVDQLEVPEVAPDMLEEQVVAVEQALGIGNVENHLDVVIANGGIQPQLRSYQITHDWLHNFQNHF